MAIDKSTAANNAELNLELDRIATLMRSLAPDLNRVAREMSKIEELTGDLLQHVNSASFGLQHNISRVEHAVALLGQQRTLELIENRMRRTETASQS
jgi:HD-like signal output (HDOD) protein